MAEDDDKDSKTEDASSKKKSDARKQGDVAQSKDVVTVVSLAVSGCTLWLMWGHILEELTSFFKFCLTLIASGEFNIVANNGELILTTLVGTLLSIVPIILIATLIASIGTTLLQTQGLVTFEPLKPKLSKLDPIKGAKNLISGKKLMEFVKNLFKISILLYIVLNYYVNNVLNYRRFFSLHPIQSGTLMMGDIIAIVFKVGLAFTVIAVFDYIFQVYDYGKKLRMTKQEVKEEYKQMEGDPKIKAKIRSKQMSMAMSRMSNGVQQADVVIRNPTHYAVALRYKKYVDVAPIIVAAGEDEFAMRIIRLADRYHVPTVENVTLARTLYATGKVDHPIPYELYSVVAKLMVDVLGMGKEHTNTAPQQNSGEVKISESKLPTTDNVMTSSSNHMVQDDKEKNE